MFVADLFYHLLQSGVLATITRNYRLPIVAIDQDFNNGLCIPSNKVIKLLLYGIFITPPPVWSLIPSRDLPSGLLLSPGPWIVTVLVQFSLCHGRLGLLSRQQATGQDS